MTKLFLASDHGGFALKEDLLSFLREAGYPFEDLGVEEARSVDYPVYAKELAMKVKSEEGSLGILICGTGLGMSMSANKVPGIRAAACSDVYSAGMARRHNDANVLCLGGRVLGDELAKAIVQAFLSTEFEGGRHERRVGLIRLLESGEYEKIPK